MSVIGDGYPIKRVHLPVDFDGPVCAKCNAVTGDRITRAAVEARLPQARWLMFVAIAAAASEVARGLGVSWIPDALVFTNAMLILVLVTLSQLGGDIQVDGAVADAARQARVYGGSAVFLDVDDRPKRQGWIARIFARKGSR